MSGPLSLLKILFHSTSFPKKQWIFCNGVKLANESVWNRLLRMHIEGSESTMSYLGYSKNLTIIRNFLNMTISENSPIPTKDVYRILNSVLNAYYPNIDVTIDFIAHHWDKFTTM